MKGLHSRLQDMQTYLENVLANKLPVNHQIIAHMQDVFNLLPNLSLDAMVKAFSIMTNDMMVIIYVSSMIRSVIALHDLINNKIENKEREIKSNKDKEAAEQAKLDKASKTNGDKTEDNAATTTENENQDSSKDKA